MVLVGIVVVVNCKGEFEPGLGFVVVYGKLKHRIEKVVVVNELVVVLQNDIFQVVGDGKR